LARRPARSQGRDPAVEVHIRDGHGRVRAFRIVMWRLEILVFTAALLIFAAAAAGGYLLASRGDPVLDDRLAQLEHENQELLNRVELLEAEVGVPPGETEVIETVPIPEMDAEPTVRVAIRRDGPSVTIQGNGLTLDGAITGGAVEVRWTQDGMSTVDGRTVRDGTVFAADGQVHLHGGSGYPGTLSLYHEGNQILVVAELPLERYLEGVVGSELPPSWGEEVKKAQAVAARSYALVRRARMEGPFALEATTLDQVYRGGSADKATQAAVAATRGQVLVAGDALVEAFYHSTCGGHTEAATYVWPERGIPWDWSTDCEWCRNAPLYTWDRTLSLQDLSRALKRDQGGMGIVTALTLAGQTPSGRNRGVRLHTEYGSVQLSGNEFRRIVGYGKVRSTWFTVEEVDEGLHLEGRGSGHGVGMCQWGAHGMVQADANYREVLSHYYRGTSLHQAYE
jgi:stage II sporulation protein D (peptidoglycan lytic transglycosylase)